VAYYDGEGREILDEEDYGEEEEFIFTYDQLYDRIKRKYRGLSVAEHLQELTRKSQ
jgi:hypothetical protein